MCDFLGLWQVRRPIRGGYLFVDKVAAGVVNSRKKKTGHASNDDPSAKPSR
jgi:hypothetical protein